MVRNSRFLLADKEDFSSLIGCYLHRYIMVIWIKSIYLALIFEMYLYNSYIWWNYWNTVVFYMPIQDYGVENMWHIKMCQRCDPYIRKMLGIFRNCPRREGHHLIIKLLLWDSAMLVGWRRVIRAHAGPHQTFSRTSTCVRPESLVPTCLA